MVHAAPSFAEVVPPVVSALLVSPAPSEIFEKSWQTRRSPVLVCICFSYSISTIKDAFITLMLLFFVSVCLFLCSGEHVQRMKFSGVIKGTRWRFLDQIGPSPVGKKKHLHTPANERLEPEKITYNWNPEKHLNKKTSINFGEPKCSFSRV